MALTPAEKQRRYRERLKAGHRPARTRKSRAHSATYLMQSACRPSPTPPAETSLTTQETPSSGRKERHAGVQAKRTADSSGIIGPKRPCRASRLMPRQKTASRAMANPLWHKVKPRPHFGMNR